MPCKMLLLAAFAFLGTVALAADDEKKPPAAKVGNVDKSKLFEKMDADGDGKVTKAEFEKFEPAGGKMDPEKLKGLLDKLKKKGQA